jgi:putative membrane protein
MRVMKNIFKVMTLASLLATYSCGDVRRDEDSLERAKEANDEKFKEDKAEQDAEFVEEAVASKYAEIKLAEVANQRSRNAEVKKVAELIRTDHSSALNELKTLAQAKAISVPVEETQASKRKMDDFTQQSGTDFDEKWCKEMIDLHEDNIDKFEHRLEKTEDAELKSWISKTLPTLRTHHQKLKACHEKMKDTRS